MSFVSTISAVIWSIPFIIAPLFGYQLFKIADKSLLIFIQKKLKPYGSIIDNEKPTGFLYGKWYVGSTFDSCDRYGDCTLNLYLLCNRVFYISLVDQMQHMKPDDDNEGEGEGEGKVSKPITIYERTGSYYHCEYRKRMLSIELVATPTQQAIISEIIALYKKQRHVVAFIHGAAGVGKSLLTLLLAKQMDGMFCQSFNFTNPGENMIELYNSVEASKDHPLVILMDEIDVIIDTIRKGIPKHESLPVCVANKTGWCMFFDNIDRGFYPYVIFILTSNKSYAFYNEIDPAYLRKGRVDLVTEMIDADVKK